MVFLLFKNVKSYSTCIFCVQIELHEFLKRNKRCVSNTYLAHKSTHIVLHVNCQLCEMTGNAKTPLKYQAYIYCARRAFRLFKTHQ